MDNISNMTPVKFCFYCKNEVTEKHYLVTMTSGQQIPVCPQCYNQIVIPTMKFYERRSQKYDSNI